MERNESFKYVYSAKQQEEIKNIRKKYMVQEENKMEQLRKLDQSVSQKATAKSLAIGIVGALIMGCGMSLAMTNLYETLGLTMMVGLIYGICIGCVGIILVCLAYPVYCNTLKKERERIASEILRLSDELLQD